MFQKCIFLSPSGVVFFPPELKVFTACFILQLNYLKEYVLKKFNCIAELSEDRIHFQITFKKKCTRAAAVQRWQIIIFLINNALKRLAHTWLHTQMDKLNHCCKITSSLVSYHQLKLFVAVSPACYNFFQLLKVIRYKRTLWTNHHSYRIHLSSTAFVLCYDAAKRKKKKKKTFC